MKVLIADDEPLARRGIEQLLAAHPDCRVVASCRNGRETVRALRELRPDVAFLDIQMPGLDGFHALHAAEADAATAIVFVTAYDEFAVRAFDERALDYLLKPVSQARFDRALERVRERLRECRTASSGPRTLAVPTATGMLLLDDTEIDWIEAEDYCAAVHTAGKRHLIRESLNSLEQRLDPARFVRVHRSAIVRIGHIRELHAGGEVVLRDGYRLPVSRRRRRLVFSAIRRGTTDSPQRR